jgi:glycerophosphoryl diester phosphodiesterase
MPNMKIIAHRGFSSRAPENTMAAFLAAIEFGVDGLELDVHRSKDGEIVVCHDEMVNRTTNGEGYIQDLTWHELRQLDAGGWYDSQFTGERLPLLSSVLYEVKRAGILLNIELKTDLFSYPGIEEQVIQLLQQFDLIGQCIISSFNHYSLVRVTQILPELKTAILYNLRLFKPWEYAQKIKAVALHPGQNAVSSELVVNAKQNGIMVNPWTINEPDQIRRMIVCGVNAVITNYPDRVKELLVETAK